MIKRKFEGQSILIYDLECTNEGYADVKTNEMRIFGAYSYKTGKYYVVPYTERKFIEKLIKEHKFLVGFNNIGYDNPILKRMKYNLEYKRIIDLQKIIIERVGSISTEKGQWNKKLMKFSMDYITRFIGLVDDKTAKGDIDYLIFNNFPWTSEEIKKIKFYTKRDIELTKKLYEWLEDYFDGFKDFLPSHEIEGKYYLTDKIAKVVYKTGCFALGLETTYNFNANFDKGEDKIGGGYVSYVAGEYFEGDLYCFDENSAYPHIFMQCNLASRLLGSTLTGWNGNGAWEVEGTYNDTELSKVSKLLRKWYYLRLFYKRKGMLSNGTSFKFKDVVKHKGEMCDVVSEDIKDLELRSVEITDELIEQYEELHKKGVDRREYTVKICINTFFGINDNPYYELFYDPVVSGDCTRIGRQWIKDLRKFFRRKGYKIMATDTDSVYIVDHLHNEQLLLDILDEFTAYVKANVPFPMPTFGVGVDDRIKYMFFFKGKNKEDKDSDSEMDEDDFINKPLGLMKKNYVYVTTDNKIKVKNLGLEKKSLSAISKKIFWDYMAPFIKEGKIKFSRIELENVMREYLEKDISLALMRKSVKPIDTYANSKTSMPAQISKLYGPGIHFMIPNLRDKGAGKGVKYCTYEEFKKCNMGISDIDFTNFWKELNYFIKEPKHVTLFDY